MKCSFHRPIVWRRFNQCLRSLARLPNFSGFAGLGLLAWAGYAAETPLPTATSPSGKPAAVAEFVEPDFPFFSSVLDARQLGASWPTNNLTPRGLILNLGNDCWACFDVDLLRLSALWHGQGISLVGMAPGSYREWNVKAPAGQGKLPQIIGAPWLVNGIYPGWQPGKNISETDPREAGPDLHEVGRGPLPEASGRFQAIRLAGRSVCLEYQAGGTRVREWMESQIIHGERLVQRRFQLEQVRQPLVLALGYATNRLQITLKSQRGKVHLAKEASGLQTVRVSPAQRSVAFSVVMSLGGAAPTWKTAPQNTPPALRWPETIQTTLQLSKDRKAYVLDAIPLPLDNPWKRQVRPADIAFFPDGRAATVTFDGDVWMFHGWGDPPHTVSWRRFASGLHEPLSLCRRGQDLFVYDRNGLWCLRDTDGNGEADVHELFSNVFAQTAETREYAGGLRVAPDGSFIIAKGGQRHSTLGKDDGRVLRISPDGKAYTVLGWGLREPFIGVHPQSGLVTASDQQGFYVPSTPLHLIRDGKYYGFLPESQPKEKYPAPIADPLVWIPHLVNASGAAQVWLWGAQMGPLNNALIHIGYNRPELFLVLPNERASRPQAAVISLLHDLPFAPLNGAVNPRDGQLYIAGFQIWGTTAREISGLARVRYTGAPNPLPRTVAAMENGLLLRFDLALDTATATNLANFSVERWNYQRTAAYGSPHFKMNGTPGHDTMKPSSAYLSKDGQAIFLGLPDMQPVMQMRAGWSLTAQDGSRLEQNAYFTPYELTKFIPIAEGFAPLTVDLTPQTTENTASTPVTVEEGRKLSELLGCVACHSTDGTEAGKVGPTWKGLFGSRPRLVDGKTTLADEAYLRESIRDPAAKLVKGFEAGMPSYEGVISETQIEALVLYLKTLP